MIVKPSQNIYTREDKKDVDPSSEAEKVAAAEALAAEALKMAEEAKQAAARLAELKASLSNEVKNQGSLEEETDTIPEGREPATAESSKEASSTTDKRMDESSSAEEAKESEGQSAEEIPEANQDSPIVEPVEEVRESNDGIESNVIDEQKKPTVEPVEEVKEPTIEPIEKVNESQDEVESNVSVGQKDLTEKTNSRRPPPPIPECDPRQSRSFSPISPEQDIASVVDTIAPKVTESEPNEVATDTEKSTENKTSQNISEAPSDEEPPTEAEQEEKATDEVPAASPTVQKIAIDEPANGSQDVKQNLASEENESDEKTQSDTPNEIPNEFEEVIDSLGMQDLCSNAKAVVEENQVSATFDKATSLASDAVRAIQPTHFDPFIAKGDPFDGFDCELCGGGEKQANDKTVTKNNDFEPTVATCEQCSIL